MKDLLDPFGIGLSDRIFDGEFGMGGHTTAYVSGTSIVKFPKAETNYVVERELRDEGEEFLAEVLNKPKNQKKSRTEKVAILGLAQTGHDHEHSGRVVVYGDTSCVDSSHIKNGIYPKTIQRSFIY